MTSNYYRLDFDPLAFEIGQFALPWYWLVYFLGFIWVFYMTHKLNKKLGLGLTAREISTYFQWSWVALFLGSRVFYVLFYNLSFFLKNPDMILKIWLGGMSFHGALLGILLAIWLVARRLQQRFILMADILVTTSPLVLGFGRVTNFINGELAGRVTDVPWAVIFPRYKDGLPRHPSQLYQGFLEGFLLFILLFFLRKNIVKKPGLQSIIFLAGYGLSRFFIEFFREPDKQLGFFFSYFTLGQFLCLLMIVGSFLMYRHFKPQWNS